MNDSQEPDNQPDAHAPEAQTLQQSPEGMAAAVDISRRAVTQSEYAPKVPGYALEKLLGEGAYGQVWRGTQIRTNKTVAIKVFIQRGGLDWIFLQREVERLTKLDRHPNIVTLLDTDLESEPPSYVMDLIEGGALDQYVDADTPTPQAQVMRWAGQICQALSYVHAKGLIHCDLKPANILVDGQDNIRVVDFGQSRVFTESAASLGTLYYMAPEQAKLTEPGKPVQPDVRWDIYALGATMYAMLVGFPPHASVDSKETLSQATSLDDRLARYRALVNRETDILKTLRERHVGVELAAIIDRCVESDPANRYDSITGVLADLDAIGKHRPVSPLAKSRTYRIKKFIQRNPFRLAAGAAVLTLLPTIYVARQEQSKAAEAEARGILAKFDYAPHDAFVATTVATGRLRDQLVRTCDEYLSSRSATLRTWGALSAFLARPEAFWSSVDGGTLWANGEWLALADADWADEAEMSETLAAKAVSGSDREKYVAFCLIGALAGESGPLANHAGELSDLCGRAVTAEAAPGTAAAARWAATRLGSPVAFVSGGRILVDSVTGMTFMRIPRADSYQRGAASGDRAQGADEARVQEGTRIGALHFSATEVPMSLMERFVNSTASDGLTAWVAFREEFRELCRSVLIADRSRFAAPYMTLDAAREFCAWLNTNAKGTSPRRVYRLPTESEWEYACRGGNEGRYCYGDDPKYALRFTAYNVETTYHVLGERMPNWYGLQDMHGGLWEICDSRYEDRFLTEQEWVGKEFYVKKGGGYYGSVDRCRTTQRYPMTSSWTDYYTGVRIVMELETE